MHSNLLPDSFDISFFSALNLSSIILNNLLPISSLICASWLNLSSIFCSNNFMQWFFRSKKSAAFSFSSSICLPIKLIYICLIFNKDIYYYMLYLTLSFIMLNLFVDWFIISSNRSFKSTVLFARKSYFELFMLSVVVYVNI